MLATIAVVSPSLTAAVEPMDTPEVPRPWPRQLRDLVALAIPVVLGELGWMAMSVVDMIIVGQLGPSAIATVGLGTALYYAVGLFGLGLFLGMDTLVSQAFGAGQIEECNRTLWQGVWLAIFMTPFFLLPLPLLASLPAWIGTEPAIQAGASNYLFALATGTLPLFLYSAFRRYLQGMSMVKPVMIAIVSANIVNAVANQALIFGLWGCPRLGVVGSGYATAMSRCYMALVLLAYLTWRERRHSTGLFQHFQRPNLRRMALLIKLGLPAALQLLMEVGIFGLGTLFISRYGALTLAAHQIMLNTVSVTYMVPLGISSASAVAVGQAIGRRSGREAIRAGWMALALGGGFMTLAAMVLLIAPGQLFRLYSHDPAMIRIGIPLLFVGALFQTVDGVQIVATGILRGWGDTRTPMISNFAGHWMVGLPTGYILATSFGLGVMGVWYGLSLGLFVVAIILLLRWRYAAKLIERQVREGSGRQTLLDGVNT